MSTNTDVPKPEHNVSGISKINKAVIWTAISALIASAIICVGWVLFGTQSGLVAKAFLTVGLLTAFAFVTIADVKLSETRPDWLNLISMGGWIALLIIGASKIWMPLKKETDGDYIYQIYDTYGTYGVRVWFFILAIAVVRLAVVHFTLYVKSIERQKSTFNNITGYTTIGLVSVLTVLLVTPLVFSEWTDFDDFYWRVTISVAILGAVGTALVPLYNALTAPKKGLIPTSIPPQNSDHWMTQNTVPWPTYADGVTPLPALPNGQPDFEAAYLGHASTPQGSQLPTKIPEPPQRF